MFNNMTLDKDKIFISSNQLIAEANSEYECEECGIASSVGDIFYIAYDTEGDGYWSAYICENCSKLFNSN